MCTVGFDKAAILTYSCSRPDGLTTVQPNLVCFRPRPWTSKIHRSPRRSIDNYSLFSYHMNLSSWLERISVRITRILSPADNIRSRLARSAESAKRASCEATRAREASSCEATSPRIRQGAHSTAFEGTGVWRNVVFCRIFLHKSPLLIVGLFACLLFLLALCLILWFCRQ